MTTQDWKRKKRLPGVASFPPGAWGPLTSLPRWSTLSYKCESWTIQKGWAQKNDAFKLWCWGRLLRVLLESKEVKPANPKENQHWLLSGRTDAEAESPIIWPPDVKSRFIGEDSWESLGLQGNQTSQGNQPWIFIGRTDAEAESPIIWPPDVKNWLIGKDLDAGQDWRWEEKGMTENKIVNGIMDSTGMSLSRPRELVMGREAWHAAVMWSQSQTRLSDWTELIDKKIEMYRRKVTFPRSLYVKGPTFWVMGPNFTCFKL